MKSEIPENIGEVADIVATEPEVVAVKKHLSEIEKAMPEIVEIKERGVRATEELLKGIVSYFQNFDSTKKPADMENQTFEAMVWLKNSILKAYEIGKGVDSFTIGYNYAGSSSLKLSSTADHDFSDAFLHGMDPETFVDETTARDFYRSDRWRQAEPEAGKYFRGGDAWGAAHEHNPAKARAILDKILGEFPL